jgi:hypothetical protein
MSHATLNAYLTETGLAQAQEIVASVTALGHRVLRNGLALVIGWIGMMKFTGYEARGSNRSSLSHCWPGCIRSREKL